MPVFLLVLGIGLLALAAWGVRGLIRAHRKEDRLIRGITVPGMVVDTVTEVKIIHDSDHHRRKVSRTYPVLGFRTGDGRDLTVRSPYPDDSVVTGSRVNVTYAREDPTQVRIAGHSSGTPAIVAGGIVVIVFGLVGLILTLIGVIGLAAG